jgi:hypothetical protein
MSVTNAMPLGCLPPLTGITSSYRHHLLLPASPPLTGITSPYRRHLLLPAFLAGVYVLLPVHSVHCNTEGTGYMMADHELCHTPLNGLKAPGYM